MLSAGEDKSWKVRFQLAKHFPQLAGHFSKDVFESSLIQIFNLLLNDSEPEVKKEALSQLDGILDFVSQEKI